MARILTFILFVILTFINTNFIILPVYGLDSWQYWVSTICVCGAYLAGALHYIFKD